MEFFLDWAWNRVASIKQRADKETLLLFDHSCLEVPDTIRMTLVLQCRQLQHLKILFEEAKNLWRHGALEVVENKCSIIHLVKLYTEAILWFLNCGLLPEKTSARFQDLFPARQLENLYSSKRGKWELKFKEWLKSNHFPAEELKHVGLLIDGLCKQLGTRLMANFERDGGNGLFPPPNLHALLSCYLIQNQDCSDLIVHRIVQYLFLDMASCLSKKETQSDEEIGIVENLIKYPSAFSVPPSFIKLTQVI